MSADPLDLVTVSEATSLLAAGGVTLSAAATTSLQTYVTAASREIQRELHRWIPSAAYDEVLTLTPGRPDRGEPATGSLKAYPVTGSPLVWGNRVTALTVTNTDATTNQAAYLGFTTTGDPDVQTTATGLTLTRVASGVETNDALTWTAASPYTTVAALAASVNGLGGGWTATASTGTPDPSLFPAYLLVGAREPKTALNSGVQLSVFMSPLASSSIDREAGIVSVGSRGGLSGFNGGWPGATSWDADDDDSPAWGRQVRVRYTAGYATIPPEFRQAAALAVKYMLDQTGLDGTVSGETAKDYSYTARQALGSLPPGLWARLMKYRDWRF